MDGSAPDLSGLASGSRPAVAGPTNPDQSTRDVENAEDYPGNFSMPEDFGLGKGTDSQKSNANLEAIRTLRKIQEEDRLPTKDEQANGSGMLH